MYRLILAALLSTSDPESAHLDQNADQPGQQSVVGQRRDFFPPWEGSGVYVFYPFMIDLNRGIESFGPLRARIHDCSNEDFFCVTARRGDPFGLVHVVAPRRCIRQLSVGDQWQVGTVQTTVIAAIRTNDPLRPHFRRPDVIYFLGDDSNPKVIYEYWGYNGIVAIYHGLIDHPNLVAEVRDGLDPFTLPSPHRMTSFTFDRFAGCRFR